MREFIVKGPPARIVFKFGCVHDDSILSEIKAIGGEKIVLIGSSRGLSTPPAIRLKELLATSLVDTLEGVEEHVPEAAVQAAASRILKVAADTLLVFGGGSALGLAKALVPAVASLTKSTCQLNIISIPTTFSGSEVTNIYGVRRTVKGDGVSSSHNIVSKVATRDERVRPKLVMYDSSLLQSLPLQTIIPSIFNAIAHAIEALLARNVGPLSSMGALESIKVALKWLPILKDNAQQDRVRVAEAIDQLLYSAYLAGTTLDQEEMALQHRLAHVLGGSYHLPHAQTHMTILPHVIHYNQKVLPPEVGVDLLTDDLAGTIYDLQAKMLSKPSSLASLGFSASDIEGAVDTLISVCPHNPVPLEKKALAELLYRCWKGDRPPHPAGAIDFNSRTSTLATLGHLRSCGNPRLKEILGIIIRQVHEGIKLAHVTDAEWIEGINFMTRVGQYCTPKRQEFVLLSDVLGMSALLDALADEEEQKHGDPRATPSSLLGPFHLAGAQVIPNGGSMFDGPLPHDKKPILVKGKVLCCSTGRPIAEAVLDLWHADYHGNYDVQPGFDKRLSSLGFRAKVISDENGNWSFRTILPSFYPVPSDGPVGQLLSSLGHHPFRPAHLHFIISARGFKPLITTISLAHDPYVTDDVVFGSSKSALIKALDETSEDGPELSYDFKISPDANYNDLDPLSYVPKGSASNYTQRQQQQEDEEVISLTPAHFFSPRVPYLDDQAFLSKDKGAAEKIMARRKGRLLNLDRILMHAPSVAQGWNAMFGALRSGLSLDGRLRELVILRVAIINQAYYEFYQHYPVFLQDGGTPSEAAALGEWSKKKKNEGIFGPKDRAILAYVDEMTRTVHVSDDIAEEARRVLESDEQLIELTALCAGYNMVSRLLEAIRIEPETKTDLPPMPKEQELL